MGRNAKHPIQEFNGVKYYFKPSGYFKADHSIGGKYMHRAVWEFHNGPIPEGYEIHHKDHNKGNNAVENLECLASSKHASLHAKLYILENPEANAASLDKARIAAAEWHGSPEGLQWHKEHGKQTWVGRKVIPYVCQHCGVTYEAKKGARKKGFCSPACQTKARRASGVDNVTKSCLICSAEFVANKYDKSKTCSYRCSGISSARSRKKKAQE